MKTFEEKIQELNERIKKARCVVFFGGAGVSTDSGIPDFRSKDGLYNTPDVRFDKWSPEYLLSIECLNDNPEVFYEFYRQKLDCRNIQPNITHYKLAELEAVGKLYSIITQNIDGLHQKAGSKNVREIHGSITKAYCDCCGKTYNENFIFESKDKIPMCDCEVGYIRPDITLYGEMLPNDVWNSAVADILAADLVIVAGSSLTVFPANLLLTYTLGDNLIIINRDKTHMDGIASLVFHEDMKEVFSRIEV